MNDMKQSNPSGTPHPRKPLQAPLYGASLFSPRDRPVDLPGAPSFATLVGLVGPHMVGGKAHPHPSHSMKLAYLARLGG